ncbi:MAG: ATP-binding protein, partial [Isosphaeraceae bacterium]
MTKSETKVVDLLGALAALHALVGMPDDRQLETYAGRAGFQLSRSTANTIRRGLGRPRYKTVEAFVVACMEYAKTRKPAIKLPADYTDMALWGVRYEYFSAADKAVRSEKLADAIGLSAQLPRSLGSRAKLLDPHSGVVEFVGRVAELENLLAWCHDDSAGRLRLLTGPGGIGKTRLAMELTRQLTKLSWHCDWVGDRQEANILADIRAFASGPVFLVVDYAETRIGLEQLLRAVAANKGTVRVLLLARTAGQWWELLAASEGAVRDLIVYAGEGIRL